MALTEGMAEVALAAWGRPAAEEQPLLQAVKRKWHRSLMARNPLRRHYYHRRSLGSLFQIPMKTGMRILVSH